MPPGVGIGKERFGKAISTPGGKLGKDGSEGAPGSPTPGTGSPKEGKLMVMSPTNSGRLGRPGRDGKTGKLIPGIGIDKLGKLGKTHLLISVLPPCLKLLAT